MRKKRQRWQPRWRSSGLLGFLLLLLSTSLALAQTPTITTDKADYAPSETVHMTGTDFAANTAYDIVVVRPDGSIIKGDGNFNPDDTYTCPGSASQCWDTVTSDGSGDLTYNYILDGILGLYEVYVYPSPWDPDANPAQTPVASTTFTDAAPYSIDFAAADPRVNQGPYNPTYVKQSPASKSCPVTSGGPGRENNPYADAVFLDPDASNTKDAVESLTPEGMALGQIVVYEVEIAAGSNAVDEDITMTINWATEATSGPFGFDGSYGVYCAFVDTGDVGTSEGAGDNATVSWTWSLIDTDPDPDTDDIEGIFTISGLEADETIIVEIWMVLETDLGGSTGTVQASLEDADTTSQGTINTGNQTVPLKQLGQFATQDVDIGVTKSDNPDPVPAGGNLTYTLVLENFSTDNPASNVLLTDTLDGTVSFVSVSVNDTIGDTTTCAHSGSTPGGQVVCGPTILNAGEVVTITIVVTAPAATQTCPDLTNTVVVVTDTDDINSSNDSDSETTGVDCPTAIELASFSATPGEDGVTLAWETATETNNAGFNLHRATSEAGPYTQINNALIPAKGEATSGAVYSYLDTVATDLDTIYYYKLEDIDLTTGSTFHGPVNTAPEVSVSPTIRLFLPIIVK